MARDTDARMRELDKKEEMMRTGKVVEIERMPKPTVPLPPLTGSLKSEVNREDRLKIAQRLVDLSAGDLEWKETERRIGLKIGSGPYSIAGTVSTEVDRVSFFIGSLDLIQKAKEEGFEPEPVESTRPSTRDKYRFWGLSLGDIEAHEALFKRIVNESVNVVMGHKGKK